MGSMEIELIPASQSARSLSQGSARRKEESIQEQKNWRFFT
jgi:hypothetical protein